MTTVTGPRVSMGRRCLTPLPRDPTLHPEEDTGGHTEGMSAAPSPLRKAVISVGLKVTTCDRRCTFVTPRRPRPLWRRAVRPSFKSQEEVLLSNEKRRSSEASRLATAGETTTISGRRGGNKEVPLAIVGTV